MLNGTVHPDFWAVARVLEKLLPRSSHGGASACVYHRGECVVDLWGGTRDEFGRAWEADTVSLSYSTTKGVASTLLHVYADRGEIDYDEPVATYWPEFAAGGKEQITVRQILCHEAGLYDARSLVDQADQILDWDHMADGLARAIPIHPPGSAHGYHGLTYGWLVGELIQRVARKPLSELLASELAGPLGLDGLYIGLPADQMHRRARLVEPASADAGTALKRIRTLGRAANKVLRATRAPIDLRHARAALMLPQMEVLDFNSEALVSASIPAANGMFTARSLARLYAVLANGGALDGVRLVSSETIDTLSRVQNRGIDRVVPFPMHWRLGYHRVGAMGPRVTRAFGHAGFGGSGAFADPERNLAVALTLNSGVGTPFGDLRMVRVATAALRAADAR